MAKENSAPTRLIAGQKTLLSRTMHDIRYDAVHDEVLVTNPFAQAVLVYRGAVNGEEAPIRVIRGPKTQLKGSFYGGLDRLEILVPCQDSILVYPREANGDVAPIRVIKGPNTELKGTTTLGVDPVNNVIVVATGSYLEVGTGQKASGALLIFNRTDEGNVKPRGTIAGPKTGIEQIAQIQMYSPKGWIVAAQAGGTQEMVPEGVFVGVWSIHDNGDVAPRWKIAGPKSTMKHPRGVALNPAAKELIVADMRLNAVLTYYFPEIF
jgi:hypothetical protein